VKIPSILLLIAITLLGCQNRTRVATISIASAIESAKMGDEQVVEVSGYYQFHMEGDSITENLDDPNNVNALLVFWVDGTKRPWKSPGDYNGRLVIIRGKLRYGAVLAPVVKEKVAYLEAVGIRIELDKKHVEKNHTSSAKDVDGFGRTH
jgi:hypothetical protein